MQNNTTAHLTRLTGTGLLMATMLASTRLAQADEGTESPPVSQSLQQVLVIASTPLPGQTIDADKIPGNVQTLSAGDLTRQGSASLTSALNSTLGSVNVNDDLADAFQPDILYRGFEASPVLGTPQGLAVYQNGVRINEAFGNTVNWDLFPDVAIDRADLVSSSPLYGLNALGGAISVTMKNGFTYQGGELELSGGSFDQRSVVAQFGVNSGVFGFYVAGRALNWTGWRSFSDDRLRDIYAAVSAHTDTVQLDLSYTGANNTLNGQGSAPAQELAISRSLVFTGPQTNINRLNFFTLNANVAISDGWSAQGVLYYRDYSQVVSNGDTSDYEACDDGSGTLCQPDGATLLTNAQGQTFPDISDGGAVPIGQNDYESIHAWGRGGTLQLSSHQSIAGHDNQFSLGVAYDYASTSFFTGTQLGVINSQLLVAPSSFIVNTPEDSDAAVDNGDPTPISVNSVNRNLGGFLTDTFDVTPAIAVTVSGRYNVAHVDLSDQLGDNLSGYNRFVHFNPAAGATYKVVPGLTAYAGWSVNTRTPTASEIECSDPAAPCLLPTNLAGDPPNLRQVVSHTLEFGLRGKLAVVPYVPGEVGWNVGFFRTLLEDDIYGIATSVSQGFFQNIGDTRRQGVEAGLHLRADRWSAYLNYSFVQATFQSSLVVPSPSNPFQDENGDIQVEPGDRLPGIPEHRVKFGLDFAVVPVWSVGATVNVISSAYYVGDESNQLPAIPGYTVVNFHTTYRPIPHVELFASIDNLLNRKYSTWGILSDPTGIGAPGVPADGVTNGPGVDNRFQSPAAPFEAFAGIRLTL